MPTVRRRLTLRAALLGAALVPIATALAPAGNAYPLPGSYNAYVDGRYDFHTWKWAFATCQPPGPINECLYVSAMPSPIARAYAWYAKAQLVNGAYTLTVDMPEGLRCGNVYYGPVIPTRDVYTFDAVTLTGKLDSSFDTGCDGAPGGTITYPLTLSRI